MRQHGFSFLKAIAIATCLVLTTCGTVKRPVQKHYQLVITSNMVHYDNAIYSKAAVGGLCKVRRSLKLGLSRN